MHIFNFRKENVFTIPEVGLRNMRYAFFTNEDGLSDGGYLIDNKRTRNVNLFSSERKPTDIGFDPAARVVANILQCFFDLGAAEKDPKNHKFYLTSYYANEGKSEPLIVSCDNLNDLNTLKQSAAKSLFLDIDDKSNPMRLGLEPEMRKAINSSDISVIRGDALIFKGIPGESIAVLGASGDAHPIMMFDDEKKIACYISGAHAAIKQGVLEKSFQRMVDLGATPAAIRVVIGPGLGPKSYEFGENAPTYFGTTSIEALTPVKDSTGAQKYLVDIHKLVIAKLKDKISADKIFNIDIDTTGFDLYTEVEVEVENEKHKVLQRRTKIDFNELNKNGPLFFSARRGIMEQNNDLMARNPGAYNSIGRHGAGFKLS